MDSTCEDLVYLFADELYEVCEQGSLGEKQLIIEARKNKRDFAVAYWDKCMKDALAGDDDSVKGVGASNGQVKGRVCVVKSPAEFYKLEKNDILVCKYTDPLATGDETEKLKDGDIVLVNATEGSVVLLK